MVFPTKVSIVVAVWIRDEVVAIAEEKFGYISLEEEPVENVEIIHGQDLATD